MMTTVSVWDVERKQKMPFKKVQTLIQLFNFPAFGSQFDEKIEKVHSTDDIRYVIQINLREAPFILRVVLSSH